MTSFGPPGEEAAGARLIDVPLLPDSGVSRDFVLVVLISVFVAFVIALIASAIALGGERLVATLGIPFAVIAAVAVLGVLLLRAVQHERHISTATRQLQSADTSRPPPVEPLQALVRSERQQPRLGMIARTLARRGFRGIAIRYVDTLQPPLAPLTNPFEPFPLNEVDSAFRGVAIDAAEVNAFDERSETVRRLRRAWRMSSLGFVALAVVQIGVQVYRAWLARTLTFEVLAWLAVLVLAFLAFLLPVVPRGPIFVVPGGIVYRRTRWFSAKSRVHLYTPSTGVLVAYPMGGPKWGWAVADGARSRSGVATELEVRTLLRAWLSPLPSPTPEMLSGLGGD